MLLCGINIMMSIADIQKKQVICVFLNFGEKISFSNDNLVIKNKDGSIKLQTTCYRIFALFIVGSFTLTSGIIQRSHKFAFPIILFTSTLKIYEKFGSRMEGNVLLRKKQYSHSGLSIGKHIIKNKINNQLILLKHRRNRSDTLNNSILKIGSLIQNLDQVNQNLSELLGIEGNSAKIYFKHQFDNVDWIGRKPRIKMDYVNSILDIGYTILFNVVEAMLDVYGFDTYQGVLHTQFYQRKSLVCDIMEPFRVIIDYQVRKSINLKQFSNEDFILRNHAYVLAYDNNKKYVSTFFNSIFAYKNEIFLYIQQYYRAFINNKDISEFPNFLWVPK